MRKHLWLSIVGILILALGILPFSSQAPLVPLFRMEMQGFTNESGPFGVPELVIHQGETDTLKILFTRQNTNDNITITVLSLKNYYGIQDMSLPEGITYAINPYSLELFSNATYSANLTIVVSPIARVGNVTLGVKAQFYSIGSAGYSGVAEVGEGFTLEIEQHVPATSGIDFELLAIIVIVAAAIALTGLTVVGYRRRKLLKTTTTTNTK